MEPAYVECPNTGEVLVFEYIEYTCHQHQMSHFEMIEDVIVRLGWSINEDGRWQRSARDASYHWSHE